MIFRIFNYNSIGLIFNSHFPLHISFLISSLLLLLLFSFFSTYTIITYFFIMYYILIIINFFYENSYDIYKNTFNFIFMYNILQYIFIWFIFSEIWLFITFFGSFFTLNLFGSNEFFSIYNAPLQYSYKIVYEFNIFWHFIDLFSIYLNTFFLIISGLCINLYINCYKLHYSIHTFISLYFSFILGLNFLWNQYWEFNIIEITLSSSVFGSFFFLIDILHFLHVIIGLFSIYLLFMRHFFNFFNSNSNMFFILIITFYWHFVDIIWFFLLKIIYLNLLWI